MLAVFSAAISSSGENENVSREELGEFVSAGQECPRIEPCRPGIGKPLERKQNTTRAAAVMKTKQTCRFQSPSRTSISALYIFRRITVRLCLRMDVINLLSVSAPQDLAVHRNQLSSLISDMRGGPGNTPEPR